MSTTEDFWEAFYTDGRARWSGRPNASLVDEIAGRRPGTALDLGCGQGGDAIWLASLGWAVTAVDVSGAALDTARAHAAQAGVGDAIRWERHDLGLTFPDGRFDLVAAAYLHSPVELPRGAILRSAAAAVAPGGTLLVIGHLPSAAHHHQDLPSVAQVVQELALPPAEWTLVVSEERRQQHAFRDEEPTERVDGVVRFERRA
jgi:SAM-dependent methyltransferase